MRGGSSASIGIHDHDEVGLRRNGKGVGDSPNRWGAPGRGRRATQTNYPAVAQIVQTQICWIVSAQICGTFNIASASDTRFRVDCDSKAGGRCGIVSEIESLKVTRSRRADSSRACFSFASARLTIAAHTVVLSRIGQQDLA